jgi:hypothetical protein
MTKTTMLAAKRALPEKYKTPLVKQLFCASIVVLVIEFARGSFFGKH